MHRGSSRYSDVRSFRLCPLFSIFEFLANFTIVSKLSDITEQSHINHNKMEFLANFIMVGNSSDIADKSQISHKLIAIKS